MSKEIVGCIWKGKDLSGTIKSIRGITGIMTVGMVEDMAVTRIPAV